MNGKKNYNELELKDDFMFGKVMSNKELCRKILETLLETTISDIGYTEREKFIQITKDEKNIRLDVYVQDEEDRVYDMEMQQKHKEADISNLPKRSRYYQGMIDLNLLESGASYGELPDSYIIFICTFDPFGKGRSRYTFRNVCLEDNEVILGDKTAKIFFNTKGNEADISEEAKHFLRYLESKETGSELTRELDKEIERVKSNETWRREYMKSILFWQEERHEAREEGREEGLREGREKGIDIYIELCQEMSVPKEQAFRKLQEKYELNKEEAEGYLNKYWKETK